MNKVFSSVFAALLCFMSFNVFAAENNITQKEGIDWSISMMPEETAEEKEAARWSIVVENEIGINAYDMASITYDVNEKGEVNKNVMSVLARTVYAPKDKELQKRIANMYRDKLEKKERLQSSNLLMVFNMSEKTYYIASVDYFSNKNKLIEHKENTPNFKAIPTNSIAEALYDICYQAAHQEENNTEVK